MLYLIFLSQNRGSLSFGNLAIKKFLPIAIEQVHIIQKNIICQRQIVGRICDLKSGRAAHLSKPFGHIGRGFVALGK